MLLQEIGRALWQRVQYSQEYYNLTSAPGEHPCFTGFASMMKDTDRCDWQREYPDVGGTAKFTTSYNTTAHEFTLAAVVGGLINIWMEGYSPDRVESCEDDMFGLASALASEYNLSVGSSIKCTAAFNMLEGEQILPGEYCDVIADFCCSCKSAGTTTRQHLEPMIKASEALINLPGIDVLRPPGGQGSFLERMCAVIGPLPFIFTCSDRINVVVQTCFTANAWVGPASLRVRLG